MACDGFGGGRENHGATDRSIHQPLPAGDVTLRSSTDSLVNIYIPVKIHTASTLRYTIISDHWIAHRRY